MKLILASNSPRRKDIFKKEGYDFEVIPSNYDENILNLPYKKELVENCAYKKALDVFKTHDFNSDFVIISADTVVVSDNKILGKPKDKLEAHLMLSNLSDKTHFVQTSVCLMNKKLTLKNSEITYVTFRKLTDIEIDNYINTKNPLDKAGSYGIQDENFDFATQIKGNLDNVIGFPMTLFKKLLGNFT